MSGQRDWLRRAAEGRASSPVPFLHWCEVCQVAAEFTAPQGTGPERRPTPGDLPRRLDGAIAAVHRSEQAQLLVEAAARRVTATEDSGTGLAPLVLGVGVDSLRAAGAEAGDGRGAAERSARSARPARPARLTRLAEELELARADEVKVPLELVACSLWPPRLWGRGSGEALARAALALDPSPEVHLALVRALVARGRPGAALVELERLAALRARDPVQERAGFRQALDLARAAAFERRGDLSATLVGLDRVGEAGWPLAGPFPEQAAGGADESPGAGSMHAGSMDAGSMDDSSMDDSSTDDSSTDDGSTDDGSTGDGSTGDETLAHDTAGNERVAVEPGRYHADRLLLESLTLALALLLGDPGVAERALLRMRAPDFEPRVGWEDPLRRALIRWRAALQGDRAQRASSGLPDASASVVFRMLASHDPVSARVAFLVIGG